MTDAEHRRLPPLNQPWRTDSDRPSTWLGPLVDHALHDEELAAGWYGADPDILRRRALMVEWREEILDGSRQVAWEYFQRRARVAQSPRRRRLRRIACLVESHEERSKLQDPRFP